MIAKANRDIGKKEGEALTLQIENMKQI